MKLELRPAEWIEERPGDRLRDKRFGDLLTPHPDPRVPAWATPEDREWYPGENYSDPGPPPVPPDWATPDDREWYPCHEEENVAERIQHSTNKLAAAVAIECQCPDRFVITEMTLFPERGSQKYVVPDLMVTMGRPVAGEPESYLAWRDPPIGCIVEIFSRRNTRAHLDEKKALYQRLQVREYLEHDPDRARLALWRLQRGQYQPVRADAEGWVWSEETKLHFRVDPAGDLLFQDQHGKLWLPPPEQMGRLLLVEAELEEQRALTAQREIEMAEEGNARRAAEARLEEQEALWRAAELRAAAEAEQRRAAEARLATEAEQRRAAEGRWKPNSGKPRRNGRQQKPNSGKPQKNRRRRKPSTGGPRKRARQNWRRCWHAWRHRIHCRPAPRPGEGEGGGRQETWGARRA